jgi:hypothetical protein
MRMTNVWKRMYQWYVLYLTLSISTRGAEDAEIESENTATVANTNQR